MRGRRLILPVTCLIAALAIAPTPVAATSTCVDRAGMPDPVGVALDPTTGAWCMDGVHLNADSAADGLAMNIRAIQGIVDDTGESADRWDYPDGIRDGWWNWPGGSGAERNTDELVAAIPAYAQYGLDLITVGMQGGHPRWQCADAGGTGDRDFSQYDDATDSPSMAARARLERVVEAAWNQRMIVNVQLFYQNQDLREPNTDEEIIATTRNTAAYLEWLATTPRPNAPDGFQNIVIEVANEVLHPDQYGPGPGGTTALDPANLLQRIEDIHAEWPGALVTVNLGWGTASRSLTDAQNDALQTAQDWVSLHANGIDAYALARRISVARGDPQLAGKPVVVTEDLWGLAGDDPEDVTAPFADGLEVNPNLAAAVSAGAGWGYYEQGCENGRAANEAYGVASSGDPVDHHYWNGFQSPPINWSPTSGDGAKEDFFSDVAAVTGQIVAIAPEPSPVPTPEPSPTTVPEPSSSPEPTPEPSLEPTPEPSMEPTLEPSLEPDPSPSPGTVDPSPSSSPATMLEPSA